MKKSAVMNPRNATIITAGTMAVTITRKVGTKLSVRNVKSDTDAKKQGKSRRRQSVPKKEGVTMPPCSASKKNQNIGNSNGPCKMRLNLTKTRRVIRYVMKTAIPERRWLVDGIEFPDHAIIELARDYGYGGDDPRRAAVALRAWHYKVKELRKADG